jgi:hypothetical protein
MDPILFLERYHFTARQALCHLLPIHSSNILHFDEIDMESGDRDQIRKTISEYREATFVAMLNKHYTHAVLYMKCMIACVPSKLNLESIETPEANQIPNENATDYAKRLFKWIDITLPAIERRMVDII